MIKRQAAGGTLCLLFEQAFPLVYCAEEWSKVEGPIACAVIYCIGKGSKVSLSWLFLTHRPMQTRWHIHSQEGKELKLGLAFR